MLQSSRPSCQPAPLPLPAGISLPPPPSWRWMGSFRFLLAFRFHRPRAGAGWAASASCWHERANQWPPRWQKRTVAFLDAESVLKSRWPLRPMATPSGHLSRPCPSSCGKSCIHAVRTCTTRSQASHQAPAARQSPCSCGCHEALAGQAVSRQVGQHPGRLRQAVSLPLPCPSPSPCLCPCPCLALRLRLRLALPPQ